MFFSLKLVSFTLQLGEGKSSTAEYAFALVEHRQYDEIRLRLYLSGEVKEYNNTNLVKTRSRLAKMTPLVTQKTEDARKSLHVLKVTL